jgi:DNA repair protein RecN (Recombination protein N)
MLEEVRISSLGVIDEAVLELSSGFTALTGETGAGKTMVVTALGLLFGGKADPARVRPGAARASVEGRLLVSEQIAHEVEDAGGDLDDDGAALVLSRTVSAEGRSRAFAGGRSVPVSLLQVLADDLVAVHGQADQRQLLKPGWPRDALDRYGGPELGAVLADYRRVFNQHRDVAAELAALKAALRERETEAEMLRRGLTDVESVAPVAGEDVALVAEEQRLSNADALHAAASVAHEALAGESDSADAVSLLGLASRSLEAVRGHDPLLAGLADRVNEASYLVSDVAAELASYVQGVDFDPARLAAAQERRAALTRLVKLYGGVQADVAGVLDWAKQASARLLELEGDDERVTALAATEESLWAQVLELAAKLTGLREACSARFASEVTEELAALAMPHARLAAVVTPLEDGPGAHGGDDVSFQLAPHPGAPPLPLHKGASGGELSRVMLAIEVVFAGADPLPTFVFDEVDAGVGGKAAVEIGRRLARLAKSSQVIVVTHLPQVAAFADNHLVVQKSVDGLVTSSGVVRLDRPGRVRELARMLGGLEDSEYGQAHAEELLALAAADRLWAPNSPRQRPSWRPGKTASHVGAGSRGLGRDGWAATRWPPSCSTSATCCCPGPSRYRRTARPTCSRRGTCCTGTRCCAAGRSPTSRSTPPNCPSTCWWS